ncbi:hypothetical protein ACS0TY_026421 [Phlomoides rotata]
MLWHAHVSWLRATVYGTIVVYPKPGEYWLRDPIQIEQFVLAIDGAPPIADVYTINGYPGPNYNCSGNVEVDAEYTKPFTMDRVMLGPGQTINVLVTANQRIGRYSMVVDPYMSAMNVPFQNITSVAYFQYLGATPNSLSLPAALPSFNDNLAVMDGLRGLNMSDVPKEIDKNLFVTIGVNVQKCNRKNPQQNCQGLMVG